MSDRKRELVKFKKHENMDGIKGWHILHTGIDFTLCGLALEYEKDVKFGGDITCPECTRIIKYCKGIKIKGDTK